ncbi:Cyclic nucleotide-gated olfactory channel [Cichlidogyrus casuarinus]|uniref:Cyclic nucleotide-gated olfactory channel n=1 Tax=Cichlidogyrus casuarinus TaxID=1844966 RepID=A0ABD2PM05_9PLAT
MGEEEEVIEIFDERFPIKAKPTSRKKRIITRLQVLKVWRKQGKHGSSNNLIESVDKKLENDKEKEPERPKSLYFVIDPSKNSYYRWIGIITVTVLYNAIVLPMRSAFPEFHQLSVPTWLAIDYTIDFIYLIDIFLGTRTGFLDQGLLVKDTKRLRQAYFKKKEFTLDVCTILPSDVLYFVPQLTHTATWLRFNRLIKIYRVFEFVDRTETRTTLPNVFRLTTLTLYILILIHFNACIYFAFSRYSGLGANSFVYPPRVSEDANNTAIDIGDQWSKLSTKYVYSFYWSTLILTTIGETPRPVTDFEYIFITIDFLVGVLIFATVVGNVGAMITNMNAARTEFQNRMDNVKRSVVSELGRNCKMEI